MCIWAACMLHCCLMAARGHVLFLSPWGILYMRETANMAHGANVLHFLLSSYYYTASEEIF